MADIPDLVANNINVKGPDSVLLITATVTMLAEADNTTELMLAIDGSTGSSPLIHMFSDHVTEHESDGATIVLAVSGLSAGNHNFAAQWRTLKGAPTVSTLRKRMLQIIEIPDGDAILKVSQTATNGVDAPVIAAGYGNLFSATGISIAGPSSVILMLGGIPQRLNADRCFDAQFSVDTVREGAVTSAHSDSTDEGNGWGGMHATTGLSAGTHSFELQWVESFNGPKTLSGGRRTFQVVEILSNAALKINQDSTTLYTSDTDLNFYDITDMSGSFVTEDNALQLLIGSLDVERDTTSDKTGDFRMTVDGNPEGGELSTFKDVPGAITKSFLAVAKDGLSAASHSFAMQMQRTQGAIQTDTTRTRTFQVVEFSSGAAPTPVMKSIVLKQNIVQTVTKTPILKNNIINSTTKNVTLKNNIINAVPKLVTLKQNIPGSVTKNIILQNNIIKSIQKTISLKNNIIQTTQKAIQFQHKTIQAVQN